MWPGLAIFFRVSPDRTNGTWFKLKTALAVRHSMWQHITVNPSWLNFSLRREPTPGTRTGKGGTQVTMQHAGLSQEIFDSHLDSGPVLPRLQVLLFHSLGSGRGRRQQWRRLRRERLDCSVTQASQCWALRKVLWERGWMKHPSFGKQEQVTGEGTGNYEPDVLFAQIAPP